LANITVSNKSWNGSTITFNWLLTGSNDPFLLVWSLNGVEKGNAYVNSLSSPISGNGFINYNGSETSVTVKFELFIFPNDANKKALSYLTNESFSNSLYFIVPNVLISISWNGGSLLNKVITYDDFLLFANYPWTPAQAVDSNYDVNTKNATNLSVNYTFEQIKNSILGIASIPATPVLSSQKIDNTNYILSWTGNVNDLFNLERATSTQNYSSVFGDLQDFDNQLNIALADITETYYYRIRTKNSVGYSSYSNIITLNVISSAPVGTVPSAPILTNAGFANQTINLSWSVVSGATSYNLEGKSPSLSSFTSLTGDITQNTINIPLTEVGSYQFRVRAKNNSGYSAYSGIVGVSVSPDPVTIQPSTNWINLSYSTDFKMLNDIITGSIIATKTVNYDENIGSVALSLYLKITSDGIVQNISTINFELNQTAIIPITKSILKPNVTIEAYVWDSQLRAYSTVYVKSLTNEVTNEEVINKVVFIFTPNNDNSIRGILNPTHYAKWTFDNNNSLLCDYPEFTGLDVPCSLTYNTLDSFVSEPDNFDYVIESIRLRYSNEPPIPTGTTGIFKKIIGVFALGVTSALLLDGGKK